MVEYDGIELSDEVLLLAYEVVDEYLGYGNKWPEDEWIEIVGKPYDVNMWRDEDKLYADVYKVENGEVLTDNWCCILIVGI
jgi:hypothetical protein